MKSAFTGAATLQNQGPLSSWNRVTVGKGRLYKTREQLRCEVRLCACGEHFSMKHGAQGSSRVAKITTVTLIQRRINVISVQLTLLLHSVPLDPWRQGETKEKMLKSLEGRHALASHMSALTHWTTMFRASSFFNYFSKYIYHVIVLC